MKTIQVLLEDRRNPTASTDEGFGNLVRQLVAEEVGHGDYLSLRARIRFAPRGGNGNVWAEMAKAAQRGSAAALVAVLDDDKLPELLRDQRIPDPGCRSGRRDGIWSALGNRMADLIFLPDNLERILEDLRAIEPSLTSDANWEKVLRKTNLLQRDRIFTNAARPEKRHVRSALVERNHVTVYLARKIRRLLEPT